MKIHIDKKENKLQRKPRINEKESMLNENNALTISTNTIIAMILVFFHHIVLWFQLFE